MSDYEVTTSGAPPSKPQYNLGTYYMVHEDTESDMDKHLDEQIDISDSSIDFENDYGLPKMETVSEDTIKKLVDQADNFVYPGRIRRLKLRKLRSKEEDSCDASGEDDERDSQLSDYERSIHSYSQIFLCAPAGKRRTWYGSTQFEDAAKQMNSNFSISESALHSMSFSPNLSKEDGDSVTILANGSNSTSSTVEEISHFTENPSPNRRKKRKSKNSFGKSDPYLTTSTPKHKSDLLKSCSYPRMKELPASTISRYLPQNGDTSTTSGAESEEDYGKKGRSHYLNHDIRNEDQPSSFSDAWDNYQFDYSSEPYSESRDSDAARRLINFGEDYRNFIDSPSDCSAFSDVSPTFRRKTLNIYNKPNQNEFSLKRILIESKKQLSYCEDVYEKLKNNLEDFLAANELGQLIKKCNEHIELMDELISTESSPDLSTINELQIEWKTLKESSVKLEEALTLQKKLSEMKKGILKLNVPESCVSFKNLSPRLQIQNQVDFYKDLLKNVNEQSQKLSALQAEIHRFTLQNPKLEQSNSKLKNDILDLYKHLDNAKTLSMEKLEQIENLLPQWETLENRLEQLQKDLIDDEKNIDIIDSVLTKGSFSDQTATSVRELAKLLSKSASNQCNEISDFLTEGSFSDSGISDEGSEHEIGERQRRFAAIRRLFRQLEATLPVDWVDKLNIQEKIINTEQNLKKVQSRCRSVVVRTSAYSQRDSMVNSFIKGKSADEDAKAEDKSSLWYYVRHRKMFLAIQVVFITFACFLYLYHPKCCDNMNNYKLSLSPKLHFEGRPPI